MIVSPAAPATDENMEPGQEGEAEDASVKVASPSPTKRSNNTGHPFVRCLKCRETNDICPEDGLNGLEENSFLASAADRLSRCLSVCAECERAPSAKFCRECSMYLCKPCSSRIHAGVKTKQHTIVDMEKARPEDSLTRTTHCLAHPKEESVLYCLSCEALACVLCAYGAHKHHNISLLADAVTDLKSQLKERAEMVVDHVGKLQDASSTLKDEMKMLKENTLAAKQILGRRVDEIIQLVRDAQSQMLNNIEKESAQKGVSLFLIT